MNAAPIDGVASPILLRDAPRALWRLVALRTLGQSASYPWIDLITAESFGDFELVVDWKMGPGGNTGIKYLVQEAYSGEILGARCGPKALGLEPQLVDANRDPDALKSASQVTGALYH
jgi:hypothetical protein